MESAAIRKAPSLYVKWQKSKVNDDRRVGRFVSSCACTCVRKLQPIAFSLSEAIPFMNVTEHMRLQLLQLLNALKKRVAADVLCIAGYIVKNAPGRAVGDQNLYIVRNQGSVLRHLRFCRIERHISIKRSPGRAKKLHSFNDHRLVLKVADPVFLTHLPCPGRCRMQLLKRIIVV